MFGQVWLWVFLFSLGISSLVMWRIRVKGKQISLSFIGSAIGATLLRAFGFFVLISLPLIDQPRISGIVILPILGIILFLFGITLIIMASRELMKTKWATMRPPGTPEKLIKTGPYNVIRHPANVGFVSIFVGWSLAWGAIYCLCFAPILIIGLVIESFWEERNLERVFGNEYREYKKKVGMFLPKIRKGR